MRRLPAVQQLTAVNDRLSLQATAGPDPLLSFEFAGSGRSNCSGKATIKRQVERRNAVRSCNKVQFLFGHFDGFRGDKFQ